MSWFRSGSGSGGGPASKAHSACCPCEALLQKAIELLQKKNYQEAASIYDQILEIHPEDERAWSNKGICLGELGRNDEALKCLNKAIDFNPRYVFALSSKAAMLAQMRKFDEASVLMDKALEINPEFEDVLANKGRLLIDQGRHLDSIPFFDRCLRLNPRNACALLFKAIAAIENYIQRYPNTELFNRPSADKEYSRHLKLLMDSAGLLTKCMEINPGEKRAYRYMAILLYLVRHPEAKLALQRALQLNPADEVINRYLRTL